MKCTYCGDLTTHADLIDAGTWFRDGNESHASSVYALAARVRQLVDEGILVRWSDGEGGRRPHVFACVAPDGGPRVLVLNRDVAARHVLGSLEEAMAALDNPEWVHLPTDAGQRCAWTPDEEGQRVASFTGWVSTRGVSSDDEGPRAAAAERMVSS